MSSALEIDGKKLHPIKEVVDSVSYSRDYITRLARERKIEASYVGRQWFVDPESLKRYVDAAAVEQELRRKQLSTERKREQQAAVAAHKKRESRDGEAKKIPVRLAVATLSILCAGIFGGVVTHGVLTATGGAPLAVWQSSATQEASVASFSTQEVSTQDAAEERSVSTSAVSVIGDVKEGILLLPSSGGVDTPADFFSDEVLVTTDQTGRQTVVLADEYGQPTSEEVQYVVIPVSNAGR